MPPLTTDPSTWLQPLFDSQEGSVSVLAKQVCGIRLRLHFDSVCNMTLTGLGL